MAVMVMWIEVKSFQHRRDVIILTLLNARDSVLDPYMRVSFKFTDRIKSCQTFRLETRLH